MEIREDDLTGAKIIKLLEEHLRCAALYVPLESRHVLNLDGLRKPNVSVWSIWDGTDLAGCGALKELDTQHGELKFMRTAYSHQRKGVASQMLRHIIAEAKRRAYRRVSLETGVIEYFEPARKLYSGFGFKNCAPFGSYVEDPNSFYMSKEL